MAPAAQHVVSTTHSTASTVCYSLMTPSNPSSPPSTALPTPPMSPRGCVEPSPRVTSNTLSPAGPRYDVSSSAAVGYTVSRASTEDSNELVHSTGSSKQPRGDGGGLNEAEKAHTMALLVQQCQQRASSDSTPRVAAEQASLPSVVGSGVRTVSCCELRRLLRNIMCEFSKRHPGTEINVAQILQQLLKIRQVDMKDLTEPSLGALLHAEGHCKPCVFANKNSKVCHNGSSCYFCHYYHKERRRRPKKANKDLEVPPPPAPSASNEPLRIPPPPSVPPPPPPPRGRVNGGQASAASSRISYRTARPIANSPPASYVNANFGFPGISGSPVAANVSRPSLPALFPTKVADGLGRGGKSGEDSVKAGRVVEEKEVNLTSQLLKELPSDVLLTLQEAIQHAVAAKKDGVFQPPFVAPKQATYPPYPYHEAAIPPPPGLTHPSTMSSIPPTASTSPRCPSGYKPSFSRMLTTASSIDSTQPTDYYPMGGMPGTTPASPKAEAAVRDAGSCYKELTEEAITDALYPPHLYGAGAADGGAARRAAGEESRGGGFHAAPALIDPYNTPTYGGPDTSLASLLLSPSFISFLSSSPQ